MVLELSSGVYLHTAYAISNIPELFTEDDWSLDSQEGMLYVGTYTDDSPMDSTDPSDYIWTELLDTDVNDTDEDGDLPVADLQTQADALQDQIDILQTDASDIATTLAINADNISNGTNLANEANDIAKATGQHFWTDDSGAHVTEVTQEDWTDPESANYQSGANSLWNSLGILFRRGLNNLLAILAGGADGTGEKGLAIYDGQGNEDTNIIAKFTDKSAIIGKEGNQLTLTNDSLVMDKNAQRLFGVYSSEQAITSTVFTSYYSPVYDEPTATISWSVSSWIGYGTLIEVNEIKVTIYIAPSRYDTKTFSALELPVTISNNRCTVSDVPQEVFDYMNTATQVREVVLTGITSQTGSSRIILGQYPLDEPNKVLMVGGGTAQTPANVGTIDTSGNMVLSGNVSASNITGSHSGNYTGIYTVGALTIITGNVVVNVATANSNTDVPISFEHTFSHLPNVQVTMLNIGGSYYQKCTAAGISTTGFTARVRAGNAPGNVNVNWIAIGTLAT